MYHDKFRSTPEEKIRRAQIELESELRKQRLKLEQVIRSQGQQPDEPKVTLTYMWRGS